MLSTYNCKTKLIMFKQSICCLSKLSYLPHISLQCSKFPLVALASLPPYVYAQVCYYRLREINNYEFCVISGGGGGGAKLTSNFVKTRAATIEFKHADVQTDGREDDQKDERTCAERAVFLNVNNLLFCFSSTRRRSSYIQYCNVVSRGWSVTISGPKLCTSLERNPQSLHELATAETRSQRV